MPNQAVDLPRLEAAIRNSWDRVTSANSHWSAANPSRGQCAVTALVFQDYAGGEIVWTKARFPNGDDESHYFNRIGKTEYDLTRLQFPVGTEIDRGTDRRTNVDTRIHILTDNNTNMRYETLRERVAELLKGE